MRMKKRQYIAPEEVGRYESPLWRWIFNAIFVFLVLVVIVVLLEILHLTNDIIDVFAEIIFNVRYG